MGLPVEINPLFVSSTSGYQVGRSLRFRSSASAYLNRTPASASNRQKWTLSFWTKFSAATGNFAFLSARVDDSNRTTVLFQNNQILLQNILSGTASSATTSAVFRDPSAWYHINIVYDSAQATASNRFYVYVNGVLQTTTGSYPAQNDNSFINYNVAHGFGRIEYSSPQGYYDGYMAEVNFIDGQALTPSSFGAYDTNGVWQPKKYTGTYGTNGFYLPFSNTTSTTTLVQDSSGNGNNWTPNNISLTAGTTYDSMIDSPTVSASASNYAVLNSVYPASLTGTPTINNGNLALSVGSASWKGVTSTIAIPTSGKYYAEITNDTLTTNSGPYLCLYVVPASQNMAQDPTANSGFYGFCIGNTRYLCNGSGGFTSQASAPISANGIIQIAIDVNNSKVFLGINNTWYSAVNTTTSAPDSGGTQTFSLNAAGYFIATNGFGATGTESINFGQRPFTYTPPSGFNALNTYNLPAPSIANGAQYMAATTYTGTGATQSITNGGNNTLGTTFQPDLIWGKARNSASSNVLTDVLRGVNSQLSSNLTNAQDTQTDVVTAFNSNGFTVGASAGFNMNQSGSTLVAWQWKAGGTGVTNTSGTITSTVSANPTAGFSIVTYTGNGSSSATVGHGLGVTPNMIFVKCRSVVNGWFAYHSSFTAGTYLQLNSTSGSANISSTSDGAISTSPTSSTFGFTAGSVGVNNVNQNTQTFVAYCFAAISGYSAFGLYAGNGSTDGPFVYLGFRPRFVLIKKYTSGAALDSWEILDTSRNTYNLNDLGLYPNTSGAEASSRFGDILSNGFKLRFANGTTNESGYSYIYAAFAENPFTISRAR